ncbi:MAG: DinB family protein [Anaerolineales bacterium]|jgi:hypothetical protein
MKELREYQARLMNRMWSQPQELRQALSSFEADDLLRPLEQNGWSPHQVVAHLCHVEWGAFLPRYDRILKDEDPLLANFDETTWMETYYDSSVPIEELLKDFDSVRQSARDLLDEITPDQLSRTGRHPYQGERTLQWWIEYAVSHADEHLRQLAQS